MFVVNRMKDFKNIQAIEYKNNEFIIIYKSENTEVRETIPRSVLLKVLSLLKQAKLLKSNNKIKRELDNDDDFLNSSLPDIVLKEDNNHLENHINEIANTTNELSNTIHKKGILRRIFGKK